MGGAGGRRFLALALAGFWPPDAPHAGRLGDRRFAADAAGDAVGDGLARDHDSAGLAFVSGIGLYYALVNASWLGHTRMRWLGLALAVTGLGLAAFAFVSVNWSITAKLPFIPARLYSFFPQFVTDTANPNVMGGSVVLLILAVSGLPLFAWHKLPWIDRLSYLAAGVMGSAILLLTQLRTTPRCWRWRVGWLCW